MNIADIKQDIADLEGAINSPSTPDEFKSELREAKKELEDSLEKLQAAEKAEEKVVEKIEKVKKQKPTTPAATAKVITIKKELAKEKPKAVEVKKKAQSKVAAAREKVKAITKSISEKVKEFNKGRSEDDIKRDQKRVALHPGKRKSADGNTYYEYRANMSDIDRRVGLAKGGKIRTPAEFNALMAAKKSLVAKLTDKQVADMWNEKAAPSTMTEEQAKSSYGRNYLAGFLAEQELNSAEYEKYFAKGGKVGSLTKEEKVTIMVASGFLGMYKSKYKENQVGYTQTEEILYQLQKDPTDFNNLNMAILTLKSFKKEYPHTDGETKTLERIIAELTAIANKFGAKNKFESGGAVVSTDDLLEIYQSDLAKALEIWDNYTEAQKKIFKKECDEGDAANEGIYDGFIAEIMDFKNGDFAKGGKVSYCGDGAKIETATEFYQKAKGYLKETYGLEPEDMNMTDDDHPASDSAYADGETPCGFIDGLADKYDLDKINAGPYGFADGGVISEAIEGAAQMDAAYGPIIESLIDKGYFGIKFITNAWDSGGGFEHFAIQRPDKRWLIFNNNQNDIFLSAKPYETADDVYEDFWENGEDFSLEFIEAYVPDEKGSIDNIVFRNPDEIVTDIIENKWQTISMEAGGTVMYPNTLTAENIKALAIAFIKEVKEAISPEDMQEVIRLNNSAEYLENRYDSTHNFIDPNQSMLDAFEKVMGREFVFYNGDEPETEKQSDIDNDLWEAAWELARINNYDASVIEPVQPVDLLAKGGKITHKKITELAKEQQSLVVVLSSGGNRDFQQYAAVSEPEIVPVKSLQEAKEKSVRYIRDNDLGGGNWTGGQVYDADGKLIAQVSYNGRVWEGVGYPNGKLISLEELEKNYYAAGGRIKSALMRDRAYTSAEEWEKKYNRKGGARHYNTMAEGGEVIIDADSFLNSHWGRTLLRTYNAEDLTKAFNEGVEDASNGKQEHEDYYTHSSYGISYAAGYNSVKKVKGGTLPATGSNINVFGYQTQNFDIAPKAVDQINQGRTFLSTEITGRLFTEQSEGLQKLAQCLDEIFAIEKEVVKRGKTTTKNLADVVMKISLIGVYNMQAGMIIDINSFLVDHIANIAKLISPDNYDGGGRLKSAINRDRKYLSTQEHEQSYNKSTGSRRHGYDVKERGGTLNHGFIQGDKIHEIYKGYAIIDNENDGVIQVINPEQGTRFIIDLDDSKMTGSRTSSGMNFQQQLEAARKYIDHSKPIELGLRDGNYEAKFSAGGTTSSLSFGGMVKKVDKMMEKLAMHYIPGLTEADVYETYRGNFETPGEYDVDKDTDGDGSKLHLVTLYLGDRSEEIEKKADEQGYDKFAKFAEDMAAEKGLMVSLSWGNNDNCLHLNFSEYQDIYNQRVKGYAGGGDVKAAAKKTILDKEYYKTFRIPGNGRREYNIFQSHSDSQLKQAAHTLFPNAKYEEHAARAKDFNEKYKETLNKYIEYLETEFKKQFGRRIEFTDYKVSGIFTSDFTQETKNKLRSLLIQMGEYKSAYYLHNACLKKADKVKGEGEDTMDTAGKVSAAKKQLTPKEAKEKANQVMLKK